MKNRNYPETNFPKEILEEPAYSYSSAHYFRKAYSEISKGYIKEVLQMAKLSVQELIQIIPVSIDTFKRKKVFHPPVTEKILEIEEVYHKGLQAFGTSFYDWMETSNPALGHVKPKVLLSNSFGVRLLLDEIGRLEHGVLA